MARLEVITGPMFSGKTELLIARLNRALFARKRIRVLKPAQDTRVQGFIAARAVSADGAVELTDKIAAAKVGTPEDFHRMTAAGDYDVLGVDEAQFFPLDTPQADALGWFGRALRDLLQARRHSSLRVIVAGLDMDFQENPFGPMPGLMAMADRIDKLTGVCMVCGSEDGTHTHRLVPGDAQLVVGDAGEYQVRCRACYNGR